MGTYTPGPWHISREVARGEFVTDTRIRSTDKSHIAHIGPCEIDANARLICAAPDMLDALNLALATIERLKPPMPYDSTQGSRDVIKAAILKATGEKQ